MWAVLLGIMSELRIQLDFNGPIRCVVTRAVSVGSWSRPRSWHQSTSGSTCSTEKRGSKKSQMTRTESDAQREEDQRCEGGSEAPSDSLPGEGGVRTLAA